MHLAKLFHPKSLDTKGIAHFMIPAAMVLIVAIAGTYMLVASHANSISPSLSAGLPCKKGTVAYNALPSDFLNASLRKQALQKESLGRVCLKASAGQTRERYSTTSKSTIIGFLQCPTGFQFSYDINAKDTNERNPPIANRYVYKNASGVYYCVRIKDVGNAGTYVTALRAHRFFWANGIKVRYCPNPPKDARKAPLCNPKYAFFYRGDTSTLRVQVTNSSHTAAVVKQAF